MALFNSIRSCMAALLLSVSIKYTGGAYPYPRWIRRKVLYIQLTDAKNLVHVFNKRGICIVVDLSTRITHHFRFCVDSTNDFIGLWQEACARRSTVSDPSCFLLLLISHSFVSLCVLPDARIHCYGVLCSLNTSLFQSCWSSGVPYVKDFSTLNTNTGLKSPKET